MLIKNHDDERNIEYKFAIHHHRIESVEIAMGDFVNMGDETKITAFHFFINKSFE